jgi:two-component system OmpR family sensor kinase
VKLHIRAKVSLSIAAVLIASGLSELGVTAYLINRETRGVREQLVRIGLRMLRAGPPSSARWIAEFGPFQHFWVAAYDAEGRLLTANRDGAPTQLAAEPLRKAAERPNDEVFLEPYSLGHDNVAIMRASGESSAYYVAIIDRWVPRRVNRAVSQGVLVGLLLSTAVGMAASALIMRWVRRRLREAEAVVRHIAEAGQAALPLPDLGDDEVGRLAKLFNELGQRLQRSLAELRSEQEERRRAFAAWSHEIATPLSCVLGYIESLGMEEFAADPELRRRYIATAYEQALAIKALTDDLSTLSQLDFDGFPLHRVEVDVAAIAGREIAALEQAARQAQVAVRLYSDPEGARYDGDPERLGQVVRNLVKNAIQHSPPGSEIEVRVATGDAALILEVEDHGEGILAEHLCRLGERFYRADASRSRRTGGRGLGLAISRGIVESHGGRLVLRSEPAQGTVARIELPSTPYHNRPRD